jgi:hypothetical protein
MSGANGYGGEMPEFPYPRPAGERPLPGVELDQLLAGELPAEPRSTEVAALARLLGAAAAPPSERELAGEAAAVAAFVRVRDAGSQPQTAARRRSMLATLLSTKLAAAAAAGALGFGGVAAAAYAGALPEPIQDFAHQTVGAPSADNDQSSPQGQGQDQRSGANENASGASSGEPVGPDATGSAMYGLCTAFAAEKAENGTVDTTSVAYESLAKAAGGTDKIDEFCADVMRPGDGSGQTNAPAESGSSGEHPTGPPTEVPDSAPTTPDGQPTGLPTPPDHPTAQPTDVTSG